MHWINTSTLKLNASRSISRISEQGLEPLHRLSNACLPPLCSKPSGASVTHWWAAVSFPGLTLGCARVSLYSCICLRVFSNGKVNLVYPPQKVAKKIIPVVHWEVSRKGKLSIKEINSVLLTAVHKVLRFDNRSPHKSEFLLHPNSKVDILLWFDSFRSTRYLSFWHLLDDDKKKGS